MIDAYTVKQCAQHLGADVCGIAPVDRFRDAPAGFKPTDIYPAAASVVVVARKFPEGPFFSTNLIPYTVTNDIILADVIRLTCLLACQLEQESGVVAVPVSSEPYEYWDAEHREGRGLLSLKHAGQLAGLGVIGKNSLLVHPVYGNRIVLGAVLLNLDLQGDPIISEPFCPEDCHRCVAACPVGAIDGERVMVDQLLCRSHSEGKTKKGYSLYMCYMCRRVCPNGTKM